MGSARVTMASPSVRQPGLRRRRADGAVVVARDERDPARVARARQARWRSSRDWSGSRLRHDRPLVRRLAVDGGGRVSHPGVLRPPGTIKVTVQEDGAAPSSNVRSSCPGDGRAHYQPDIRGREIRRFRLVHGSRQQGGAVDTCPGRRDGLARFLACGGPQSGLGGFRLSSPGMSRASSAAAKPSRSSTLT